MAAIALLATACTGTTPTSGHSHVRHQRPQAVQSSSPPSAAPATSPTPAAQSSTPSPASPAAVTPCASAQLTVSLKRGGVAAGSTYQRLVFTNAGSATCSLTGFPGVSYVTSRDGTQIGAAADRMGPTRSVSLSPGASVDAVLQASDARNYPEDQCRQTSAGGLRVYPPNQTSAVFVRDRALTCADSSVQVLHVGSVRAG